MRPLPLEIRERDVDVAFAKGWFTSPCTSWDGWTRLNTRVQHLSIHHMGVSQNRRTPVLKALKASPRGTHHFGGSPKKTTPPPLKKKKKQDTSFPDNHKSNKKKSPPPPAKTRKQTAPFRTFDKRWGERACMLRKTSMALSRSPFMAFQSSGEIRARTGIPGVEPMDPQGQSKSHLWGERRNQEILVAGPSRFESLE